MTTCPGCGRPSPPGATRCPDCGSGPADATAVLPAGGPFPATRRAAVGIGMRFQPVPDCRLVTRGGSAGPARIATAPGTPVHAVASGVLLAAEGDHVVVRGSDGFRYGYRGLRSDAFPVRAGSGVRAGDILGCVDGSELEVDVVDATGAPVDAVELLLGLPDPNDLGYAAAGIGVDPDAIDRELATRRPRPRADR